LIAVEPCADGKVRSVIGNCYGECVDKAECDLGSPPPPDGSGGSGGSGGNTGVDCDTSKVTCQTFAPVECPVGQVPSVLDDCYGKCVDRSSCATPYDCDPNKAGKETPPSCPYGEVPSVFDGKYGHCVSKNSCIPMACLAYIEESDKVCSRPYNDPCRGQDPDCSAY
jgi:hypothetical protein